MTLAPPVTLGEILSALAIAGFSAHDQSKHLFSPADLRDGRVAKLANLAYLHRVIEPSVDSWPRFQYASVVSYQGTFCEIVFESYLAAKNTQVPKGRDSKANGAVFSTFQLKGFVPMVNQLARTLDDLACLLRT